MGTFFASLSGTPGFIEDSLVVGETGNKGNPESWEDKGLDGRDLPHPWAPHDSVRGLQYYDGPMVVQRTLFANFSPNSQRKSGGITNLSPNPFWVSSASSSNAIDFLNANHVWFDPLTAGNEGDSFSVIRDADGSITGTPNRRIVPNNPVLYTASCTKKAVWNAYICPHNYVGVMVQTGGVNIAGTVVTRNDGAKRTLGGKDGPDNLHFVTIEDRPYSIDLPVAVPSKLTFVRYEQAGKAVRLSLKYPTVPFTVTLWGSNVHKAVNISELASGGTKYFYDTAANRLHLRLVSDDGSWKEFEVNK
jgi:hypothetical protein